MKISRKSQGFTSLFLALILFNFSSQISGAYPDFCDKYTVGTDINLNVGESRSLDLVRKKSKPLY